MSLYRGLYFAAGLVVSMGRSRSCVRWVVLIVPVQDVRLKRELDTKVEIRPTGPIGFCWFSKNESLVCVERSNRRILHRRWCRSKALNWNYSEWSLCVCTSLKICRSCRGLQGIGLLKYF